MMSLPQETLLITVDVECDSDGGPTWRYSSPLTFTGVQHGLSEALSGVLKRSGAQADLLVSNVVLEHGPSVELLREMPRVELGAHLHGDFLSPNQRYDDPAGAVTRDNQNEYTDEVERQKLSAITRLFQDAFDRQPRTFRAGRWSAGGRTAVLLSELGYLADSSVSPHVHWTDNGRSVDYRNAPEQPYRPDAGDISRIGDSGLWELPVSIVSRPWLPFRPAWLRPSRSSVATMKGVIRSLRRRHDSPRVFVMMFHNNELTAGASPYSRDTEAAKRVEDRLQTFLEWARDEGMRFSTMAKVAAEL